MLTPEYMQGAPAELEALFLRLEREVIKDICRRIAKEGRLTDSAADQAERLRDLGAGTDYIKEKIAEYSGLSDEAVDRLFFDAAQTSDEFYRNVYDRANKEYTPYEYNDYFQQAVDAAVNQTKGELRNLTQSMGFSYRGSNGQIRFHTAAEAYRDCLDYAFIQTSTGMTDYNTAVRNATRRLTESGLQFVDYASGVRNHADVAVRRAVLTGLSQYTGKISERNAQELDTDIVEVSAHMGARPDHAEWQGKWYSLSGKSKKYPSLVEVTGYGTGAGLKGWNCRHDFYPVIPGISEPSYTEEELKNIDPPPFEYNGKTYTCYEATQRQRAMERAMRKTKRELLAADSTGDKDRFTEKSVLLRRQKEDYNKFSKAAGLLTQNERTQVNGFGRSQASRATWAAKKGQGSSGSSAPASGSLSGSSSGTPFQTSIPQNNTSAKTRQIVVDRPTATSGEKELFRGLTNGGGSGKIKSSGNNGGVSNNHWYEYITTLESLSPESIDSILADFENKYLSSDIEHCRVITKSGEVYDVHGDRYRVNTGILGDKMEGSINEHNHVLGESHYSFSFDDFMSVFDEKSDVMIAIDHKFKYSMREYFGISADEAYEKYKLAEEMVLDRKIANKDISDDDEQHEIIKQACDLLGIKYTRRSIV